MTLEALLKTGRDSLREAGIPDADLDAWLLMEYSFSLSRSRYLLDCRREAQEEKAQEYQSLIGQRRKRIPLQHLTHQAWFMGEEYYVDGRVLVPRQDTEILAEEAGKYLRPEMQILDLCTGSGCLLFSLLNMQKTCRGIGADLSTDALAVAEINRQKLGISPERAELRHSDLFQEIPETFDLIVSNPPYIPTADIEGLSPEVREHDPFMALDGREDGLWFYREITREAVKHLKPGGGLFYEIGWDQGEAVAGLLVQAGFTQVSIKKDYAGLDRVVSGVLSQSESNR